MKVKLVIILLVYTSIYAAPVKRITWEPVPGAWGYYLEIKDDKSNIIINVEITDNYYAVTALEPGEYSFRIATLNILKQKGESTPWIDFVIEKLYIPELKSVSPGQLISSITNKNILAAGINFKPGAKIFIRGNGREIEITDVVIKSDSEALFSFKPDSSMKGVYDLVIINRGDVESVLKNGVEIVEAEEAENIFYAGAGYTVNMPMGVWSDYYKLSYTGAEFFFQSSGRNMGLENILFEAAVEAVRYNNIDSLKRSTFSYTSLQIGSGYYYPLMINKLELFVRLHGGVLYTYLTLDENPDEGSVESIDLSLMAGAGVRAYISESLFVDSSCSWRTVFYAEEALQNVRLSLACGVKW
ncbi:MAG: hypothetical protein CVV49_02795 [Spirochaetae bacterium HGW-Spirochaetae-5]|nr:MAG: hypothetical protein CVV49_02795 [Spirochaetae bacterium HGW-Spirochaetae-5]